MRDFQQPGRSAAYADRAMVATSHPLATQTALDMLRAGGNAVDAAIAAVAVQSVVESHMTGIGGDCFLIYKPNGKDPIALNGSGRAPAASDPAALRDQGHAEIPRESPFSVSIPGAVDAWAKIHGDHGKLEWAQVLAPAIGFAKNGYRITPRVAYDWSINAEFLAKQDNAAKAFLTGAGTTPGAGDKHAQPALGATLERIAKEGRDGFYAGPVAEEICAYLKDKGGVHTLDDFDAQRAEYVTPISTDYRGHTVLELPPNGQGVNALLIMNILTALGKSFADLEEDERIHYLAEATKLGYATRDRYVADPAHAEVGVDALLSAEYAQACAAKIAPDRALPQRPIDLPKHRDTIYLCVVDEDGNAISFINSIFHSFGSGLMTDRSGVLLHSRAASFVLEDGHPNILAGGKRPMHTIIPGMVMKDGDVVMPFGVMGGHYQATGQAHHLSRMFDMGMDPQEAMEAPRSFADGEVLEVETAVYDQVRAKLEARGQAIAPAKGPIGGSQAIWIDRQRGVLIGGTDPRKDGLAFGY
ncbi:MAG: gamma-glutamyltransferase [Alphaproteobacteria bacterium]|nr:gamma-glutamyltransferase [Alphaproteobacteria bacterium]